jgi:NAD(P)-dependent dehydrogenase (short-subunit alcohol dehydrogenase family)
VRLKDKVAIVTGSGSGLGRATAMLFAREGAKVVGCGRRVDAGEQTVASIREAGGEAIFVQADLASSQDIQKVISETVERYGRLDVLVNNASAGPSSGINMGPTAEIPDDDWQRVLDINLTGTFLFCKYGIRQMLANGGGVIANVSSIGGKIGMYSNHNYCVSKAGVISLTKCIGVTYARKGIRANCFVAGSFESDFIAPFLPHIKSALDDPNMRYLYNPVGRMSSPEELAPALLFLCSSDSSYMYGEAMVVDGAHSIAPIPAGVDG